LPILAVVMVLGLAALTVSYGSIQGNQIGVLVNNVTGAVDVRTRPGAFLYIGLINDFYTLDNTVQTVRLVGPDQVNIKTAGGADVNMDVEVNYRLVQDPVVIRDAVIPECGLEHRTEMQGRRDRGQSRVVSARVDAYKVKWVRDYSRTIVRYVFGELEASAFYVAARRDAQARASEAELNELLRPHGIEVLKVVPDEFHFYKEYEQIIADKKAADQEVENQVELAKKALEEQKKMETEANARAAVEIARMKGELQKEKLAAEADAAAATKAAEAYAISRKKAADAAYYKARNDAQSILATYEAEAEGMRQLAASLSGEGAINLVKLEYAKALANARIQGVPYATDPRIQKVEVSGSAPETQAKVGSTIQ
jgi:hypothetical protein